MDLGNLLLDPINAFYHSLMYILQLIQISNGDRRGRIFRKVPFIGTTQYVCFTGSESLTFIGVT